MEKINTQFEAPYPLKSRFRKIILPSLIGLTLFIGFIMSNGSTWLTEKIYLEISENRSAIIDRALSDENPESWSALQTSTTPKEIFASPEGRELLKDLRGEVKELGLSHLKIYGRDGLLLYSSDEDQIGKYDASDGYHNALQGIRTLIEKQQDDGAKLYELYVRAPNNPNNIVMELYEPVDYLDAITLQVIVPATLIPVGVLILLATLMNSLVGRAQQDINYRTSLLNEFRQRLQELVSLEAVNSIKSATGKGDVASRRIRATILFSDVRGFTDFCENETPENVVHFLNKSLGIVIDAVREEQGDVDKMIGDAVLAHFQGDNAEERALNAAVKAMEMMRHADLARIIGIGIYSGDVVVGTIGASNRKDFTVIGDTVNVASRLCSAADKGEIVIDQQSFIKSKSTKVGQESHINVKGRSEKLHITRLSL